MKGMVWVCGLALVLVVGMAASGFAADESQGKVSAQDVKKDLGRALEKAKAYTNQQRKEYQQKIQASLDDLKKKTSELKNSAEKAKGEAMSKMSAGMEDLKKKQADAEQKLKALQSASGEAWGDVKSGLDNAMIELKKSYEKAMSYIK
jgi:t-SNARE complex subunit (syntaxin)